MGPRNAWQPSVLRTIQCLGKMFVRGCMNLVGAFPLVLCLALLKFVLCGFFYALYSIGGVQLRRLTSFE